MTTPSDSAIIAKVKSSLLLQAEGGRTNLGQE